MLYFSPSSIAVNGIGVYAAESLPKGTSPDMYMHASQAHACMHEVWVDIATATHFSVLASSRMETDSIMAHIANAQGHSKYLFGVLYSQHNNKNPAYKNTKLLKKTLL